jgi:hypothetical protein
LKSCNNNKTLPSLYTYVTIIKAWSKTYHPNAPYRTEELLKEYLLSSEPQQLPLSAIDSSGKSSRNGIKNKNSASLFTAVIQCWARSQDSTKAIHVLQLLQQMRSMEPSITPTIATYNTAIDACAKTRGTTEQQTAALKIAFAIFKTMEVSSSVFPNHVTYATLFKAISSLLPSDTDERNTISKMVFEKAVKAAQVDQFVIKNLQKSCDASTLQSLLSDTIMNKSNGHIDYDKIPVLWSSKVRAP